MSEETRTVRDDEDRQRFTYVEEGTEAHLRYRAEPGRLVLLHTEVPEAIGGRGIGGRLVRAAVERAARTGETVAPSCRFARRWLTEHPDVAGAVSLDWSEPPR